MSSSRTIDVGVVRPVYRGEWSADETYELLNIVMYHGCSWILTQVPYVTNTPGYGERWQPLSSRGTIGPPGRTTVAFRDWS